MAKSTNEKCNEAMGKMVKLNMKFSRPLDIDNMPLQVQVQHKFFVPLWFIGNLPRPIYARTLVLYTFEYLSAISMGGKYWDYSIQIHLKNISSYICIF